MSEHTITELLSPAFLSRMQNMLGDEYESFLKSYEAPRTYGLRVNTAKISCDEFERIVPFPVTPIPWISNGYFYPEDVRITADMLLLQIHLSAPSIRPVFSICRNQVL